MGALENLIYGVKDLFTTALATQVPRRARVWFRNGFSVTDDPANDRTIIDAAGGGGGGGLPITSGAHTALDEGPGGGGTALFIGEDHTGSAGSVYDAIEIAANTLVDVAVGGFASSFSFWSDSLTINNGNYLGLSGVADRSDLPSAGRVRIPYNGGAAVTWIMTKLAAGGDAALLGSAGGDDYKLGDASLAGTILATILTLAPATRLEVASLAWLKQGQILNLSEVDVAGAGGTYQMVATDFHKIATSAGTVKLPAAGGMSDGQSYEVANMSGGALTVDGNSVNLSDTGAGTATLADKEVAVYRYNSGAVSGAAHWIRVA